MDIHPIFFYELLFSIIISLLMIKMLSALPAREHPVKRRLQFFDILKGIAIISIVAIHSSDFTPFPQLLKDMLWFAIPLFIIESGYLLGARHRESLNTREFFTNILFRIVFIYLLFAVIIEVLNPSHPSFKVMLLNILLGRTEGNYYFIPLILQFYILFPLIRRIKLDNRLLRYLSFTFIISISFFFNVLNFFLQKPEWNSNPYSLAFFGRFLFFFCIGLFASRFDLSGLSLKKALPLLLAYLAGAASFSLHARTLYFTYVYPVFVFFIFIILHNILREKYAKSCFSRLIADIGRNSLIIYLVNTIIQYSIVKPIISAEPLIFWSWPLGYLFTIILVTLLSYLFSKLFLLAYAFVYALNPYRKIDK